MSDESKRRGAAPAAFVKKLRAIAGGLPGAYEEEAWVGVRWMVRKRNFAHLLQIDHGWPPAYARAAAAPDAGTLVVLTFRAEALALDAFGADPRFFVAAWGTNWGTKVVGLRLGAPRAAAGVDWEEVAALVTESHHLLAPRQR